jgi:dTDP-4-amino-4,6-dideoxygalactose transaminase
MPSLAAAPRPELRSPPAKLPVAQPYMPLAEQIAPYLQSIDEAGWYSNFGPLVSRLEERLAARFRRPTEVVTVANGTLGLAVTLQAMGLEPGALVAIPSWTFVATAHAVLQAGFTPWFLDVDEASWMLDPDHVRERLASAPGRVAAVIPVCAFGAVPDLCAWAAFRDETGVAVLLDGAAAFDALDEASVPVMVSLHATKALGVGEGGFVACEDPALARALRERTTFGFRGSRESMVVATNAKLSEYAAAVGLAGLDRWPATRVRYAAAAQRLRMGLTGAPEIGFQPGWGLGWVSSTCTVRLPEGSAARVETALGAAGLDTRRWWGAGCHRGPAFAGLPTDALPVTERLAVSTLGLPYFAAMGWREVDRVAEALLEAVASEA